MEREDDRLLAGVDLLDVGLPAQELERDRLQQELGFERRLAEAVDQLGRE
jgi:hypothetical protein